MKTTIIKADGVVGIGGVFYPLSMAGLSDGVSAVQFDDETGIGEIEFEGNVQPNEQIDSAEFADQFGAFVTAWNAEDATVKAAAIAKQATEAAAAIAEQEASASAAALAAAAPKVDGFVQAIKTGLGGIVATNSLAIQYPLFFAAISSAVWPDVQELILDAQSKSVITPTQYAAIKSAAVANNIPITL